MRGLSECDSRAETFLNQTNEGSEKHPISGASFTCDMARTRAPLHARGFPRQEEPSETALPLDLGLDLSNSAQVAMAQQTCIGQDRNHDDSRRSFSDRAEGIEDDCVGNSISPASGIAGITFEELTSRLLEYSMSRQDSRFITTFLCFFRMFAAPTRLLAAIISSFSQISRNGAPHLLKLGNQLRYLSVISHWVNSYPGDFAHPSIRQEVSVFITEVAAQRVFAAAAHDIFKALACAEEDDDTFWACSDIEKSHYEDSIGQNQTSVTPHIKDARSSANPFLVETSNDSRDSERSLGLEKLTKHSKSSSTVSSDTRSASISGSSISSQLESIEIPQQRASVLNQHQVPVTKVQWRQFIEHGDQDIADELTRIDWTFYLTIKPRDLIRHVSSSRKQKENSRNLEHVSRMVDHFNRVAFWVSHMVLLRDKAKHRAQALEKFMSIAWVCLYGLNKLYPSCT